MKNNLNSNSTEPVINETNTDLNKVLNQSAETINSEVSAKITKKRGRPAGSKSENKSGTQPQQSNGLLIKYSKDQYKNTLAGVFMISGMYLSKATGFEGFMMNQEELEALSSQGAEVCDQMMPAIDSKYVAIGGFVLACGSVYGMKYMAFKEWKETQNKKIMKEEQKEKPTKEK